MIGLLANCSGGVNNGASSSSSVNVNVSPSAATITTLETQKFSATVSNSSNTAVTWKVDGIEGGSDQAGHISADGLYSPPALTGTHQVTATSVAASAYSGKATVTVNSPVVVQLSPTDASISTIATQQFTATVENASNSSVIWSVDGVEAGNDSVGHITADGVYLPPPALGTHVIRATSVEAPSRSASVNVTVTRLTGVLTYHYDNGRSGQNLKETILTPSNVKTASFGKLGSYYVDGYVYAQPLYVANVPINGQLHNVLYVATEHDSLYAFDADSPGSGPLWQVSFIDPANGITSVPYQDTASPPGYTGPGPVLPNGCGDLTPEIGITGTPVIDPVTGTLYVVAKTKEIVGASVNYEHRLYALDIRNGSSRPGSGQSLHATFPGTTEPNDGSGHVIFQPLRQNQRAALLLSDNILTVAFSSHCVIRPYQGWALSYDAKTLTQLGAFNSTPTDSKGKGGIWHAGGGPVADTNGNVFLSTGDGPFDAASGGKNYSDTVLKLANGSLSLSDYFTPYNQLELEAANADMSASGPILVPDTNLLFALGKQGVAYLLNRDNMGKFQAGSDSQIIQSFNWGSCGTGRCSVFGTPAYYANTIYMAAVGDKLRAYTLSSGRFSLTPVQSINSFAWPGATPVVSANGASNGIVWALETNGSGRSSVLDAYAANDVSTRLYSSSENVGRDDPGPAVKFIVPTVINGRVYVGSTNQVSVFGLLP